jgi:DNA-binding NarL/FixJ family response regulator
VEDVRPSTHQPPGTGPIRVLIADDHPLFCDGLAALLVAAPGTELAGAAANGTDAVQLAREVQPDVVIMDLRMPGLNGIEATRRIVACCPRAAVIVLTMLDDDASVFAALRAGARGYLLKGADQDAIRRAVHAAAAGEAVFGAGVATRVLDFMTGVPQAAAPAFPQLTDREREVLEFIAQGRTNTTIAARLGLSEKTIRNNVSGILAKLQVADRAGAIVLARDSGLGHGLRTPPA